MLKMRMSMALTWSIKGEFYSIGVRASLAAAVVSRKTKDKGRQECLPHHGMLAAIKSVTESSLELQELLFIEVVAQPGDGNRGDGGEAAQANEARVARMQLCGQGNRGVGAGEGGV